MVGTSKSMGRVRVKICGITRPQDGQAAAALGADAIGLVFYPPSSRAVGVAQARNILQALPPFVTRVGLFVNAAGSEVAAILQQLSLDVLQFHGAEEPDYCAAFGKPYIKAVPMAEIADVVAYARRFASAGGLLLDSHGNGKSGGSGRPFDWDRIPTELDKPIILAGGLNPGNIAEAVQQVRPYAVDVSSGVESAKGIKDAGLIAAFVQNLAAVPASDRKFADGVKITP